MDPSHGSKMKHESTFTQALMYGRKWRISFQYGDQLHTSHLLIQRFGIVTFFINRYAVKQIFLLIFTCTSVIEQQIQ
jgi:hypothetical protein